MSETHLKLYDYLPSGNSYKVRWLFSYLGKPYQHIAIDIHKGDTHTTEFRAKNPAGQIPLLELSDGRCLAESNAILLYLAEGSDLIPIDPFQRAKMLQWMFWEQYRHEPAIAVARFIHNYAVETRSEELPKLYEKGRAALEVMNTHLLDKPWFVGKARSLADIALYAYTHVAEEGGFSLTDYPNVMKWLVNFQNHPSHILMTDKPSDP